MWARERSLDDERPLAVIKLDIESLPNYKRLIIFRLIEKTSAAILLPQTVSQFRVCKILCLRLKTVKVACLFFAAAAYAALPFSAA